ncbi:MAG: oligosaccharide flippase family protein [Flavobacteriaceae bacterium]|nr:oligosaccharide flippase family protein [Flavobacteriaceae bacterium]
MLDFGSKTLVSFVVTPIVVGGLGPMLFGVWQVLGQFTSYTSLADIRVTQVLKWAIAKERDVKDGEELRRYVTATFLLMLLILPVLLLAGATLAWFAPFITRVDPEYTDIVRITCAILVLALVTDKVFSIFESILRGMNLGFKRMGFRAFIYILGGGMKIGAILLGYGLVGLALVQLIVALLIGLTIFIIVKNQVPWFGFGKADIKQSLSFLKLSGWFMGWTGTKLLLLSSDKILLGYLAGPVLVTQYVITMYLVNTIKGLVNNIVHGVVPGMGKLFGNGEYIKLHLARKHIMQITWLIATTAGAVVILYNQTFLELWVGEGKYAGRLANLLIIMVAIQYVFIENDSIIINTTLEISQKIYLGLFSAVLSIILIFLLVPEYSIVGLCVSILAGRLILSIGYPLIIYRKTGKSLKLNKKILQPSIAIVLIWTGAYILSDFMFKETGWALLVSFVVVTSVIIMGIAYMVGIDSDSRNELKLYSKRIKLFSVND